MNRAFARNWKLGALAFLIVSALCVVAIWQRQPRYNLVVTFSVHPITHRIELPSLSAVNRSNIVNLLRLALKERFTRARVDEDNATFVITLESIRADSTERAQQVASTVYQELADRLGKDIDTTPLSSRLELLDARLDLVAQTLQSTGLTADVEYELKDQVLVLGAQRAGLAKQLEVLSAGIFSRPVSQLYRAQQMDTGVLLVLSLILSAFVACATMVAVDAVRADD